MRKQELGASIQENQRSLSDLAGREKLLLAEREGILDSDLADVDRRLAEARRKIQELQQREKEWQRRADDANSQIFLNEQKWKFLQDELSGCCDRLEEQKQELEKQQEVLLWEDHGNAVRLLNQEQSAESDRISERLAEYGRQLAECRKVIRLYE